MSHTLQNLGSWLDIVVYGAIGLFVLLMAGLFVAIVVAGCWEKQRVRDFVPATPDILPPPSPYFQAMCAAAAQLGFQPAGLFGQNRNSSTYRCCLSFWLSADAKFLLSIGGGKLARLNYKRTMLISRLSDEKSVVTIDSFGSEDLSGMREVQVLINADLPELNALHQQRLATAGGEPLSFNANNLLAEFEQWNRVRADRLVQQGLARYLSPDQNTWRFTPRGAFAYAFAGYFSSLAKAQAQKERANKKRPGD